MNIPLLFPLKYDILVISKGFGESQQTAQSSILDYLNLDKKFNIKFLSKELNLNSKEEGDELNSTEEKDEFVVDNLLFIVSQRERNNNIFVNKILMDYPEVKKIFVIKVVSFSSNSASTGWDWKDFREKNTNKKIRDTVLFSKNGEYQNERNDEKEITGKIVQFFYN